jgi:hypothetical protein
MTESPQGLLKSLEAAKHLRLQIALLVAGEQATVENRELTTDDEQAIQDTFDGETTLDIELERAILAEDEDLILVDGIEKRQEELATRKSRLKKRMEARRGLIHQAMAIAQWSKKETAFGTISVGKGGTSVEVDAEEEIPTTYWKPQDPALDKVSLKQDLSKFKKEVDAAVATKDLGRRLDLLNALVDRLPQTDTLIVRIAEARALNEPTQRIDALTSILRVSSPITGAHLQESGPSLTIRRK